MRNEGAGLESSVAEALAIGRAGELPVQISHHKAMGEKNWGAIERTLAMADEARAAGQDVTLDQYPYTGASTTFTAFLPIDSLAGGVDGLMGRLTDAAERRRISDFADANKPMGWDKVVVASVSRAENKRFEGKTIADVGEDLDLPAVDAGLELLRREGGPFSIIRFGMSEPDVNRVMRDPNVMVASDGHGMNPSAGSRPHPRSYGTFVRVLGKYVREEENLALEDAVRKMTSLPARRLGLHDRGLIRPGYVADMVLFRPESVQEEATFEEPHQYATGVDHVWVGGIEVWREGKDTGAVAGKVLRRGAVT
jgi:N-acyl-D-amino-acid deacylase